MSMYILAHFSLFLLAKTNDAMLCISIIAWETRNVVSLFSLKLDVHFLTKDVVCTFSIYIAGRR